MSQSPTQVPDSAASAAAANRFLTNWKELGDMVRQGASFSGRERNRCFLNTAGRRFADVSSVTGLDQIDDGRGIATVDWDHDGDLDMWLSNRTGPRVRMMRNNSSANQNFIAFRLQGTRCNRDAIGARVELVLPKLPNSHSPRIRMKTLRAGEGFLSQSSKSIHFGLGEHKTVEAVKVYWPGQRQPQIFRAVAANQRHRLVQGENSPTPIAKRAVAPSIAASSVQSPSSSERARTILTRRITFPEIRHRDLVTNVETTETAKGPLLVNVWASWCEPCMNELAEFTQHESDILAKGLRILALSVDDFDSANGSTSESARNAIQRLGFSFEAASVSDEQIRQLTDLTHKVFFPTTPLSLPCSFLIDANGKLAAFYRGPVDVDQLMTDVDLLSADRSTIMAAAIPFPGRRLLKTQEASPLSVAKIYFEGGYLELARESVIRHLQEVSAQKDLDRLAEVLSDSVRPGISREQDDPNTIAKTNTKALAVALKAEQRRLQILGLRLLVDIDKLRNSPTDVERSLNRLLKLDPENDRTRGELAIALARNGKASAAADVIKTLKERARTSVAAQLVVGQTLMQQGQATPAIHCFETAVQMAPENTEARFNLAAAFQVEDNDSAAIEQYQAILKVDASHRDTMNNLAWLYATAVGKNRNPTEAVRLAKKLCEAGGFKYPAHLDTLATALAESGEFQQAVNTATAAYRIARGRGELQLAAKLKQRVALFQAGRRVTDDSP